MTERSEPGRIVVGVDGSDRSIEALKWAVREARLIGDHVTVVHAWQLPEIGELMAANPFALEHEAFEQEAEAVVRRVLEAAGVTSDDHVEPATAMGSAAKVLLHEAEDADLLVVGSRGHGGFLGLLLGSVSQHCVQHAPCPVVVVPAPHHDDEDPDGQEVGDADDRLR